MDNWKELQEPLIASRNERNWEQFHNPKNLAIALSIEAAELNELFLWKKAEEANPDKNQRGACGRVRLCYFTCLKVSISVRSQNGHREN